MPRGKTTYTRAFGSSQGGPSRKKAYKYAVAKNGKSLLSTSNKLLRTSQSVTLRYGTDISINPGIGGLPAFHAFSATSLRDPDQTGVGHQPRGFDQLMALYTHYIVDEVCIEVWFQGTGNTCMGFVQLRDDATTVISRTNAMEYPISNEALISNDNAFPAKITMTVKPREYLGLGYRADSMKGDVSNNPESDCYLVVGAMPVTSTVDASALNAVVKITYKATLLEPQNP